MHGYVKHYGPEADKEGGEGEDPIPGWEGVATPNPCNQRIQKGWEKQMLWTMDNYITMENSKENDVIATNLCFKKKD